MEHRTSVHPAWMELDLDALRANYLEIRRRIGPDVKIIASIKANAYGHGAVEIARGLSDLGVYALATGSFSDAVGMRRAGIRTRILMFGGNLPEAAADLLRHDLIPTVYDMRAALAVSGAAISPAPIYIKVDSGLGRLGVRIEEAVALIKSVATLPRIVVEGIYTHLPFRDAAGMEWARDRLAAFDELVAALAAAGMGFPVTQAKNSACLLAGLKDRCTAVSPGHLLYGLSPGAADLFDTSAFRPVLRAVRTQLIHVAHHPPGRLIGLGGPYGIKGGTVTGVVPFGLYDGYRNPAEGTTMLLRGRRVPVIGVSLEYTTLDLSGLDGPEPGEEVTVLGQAGDGRITLEEIAGWQAARPLDVLMSFGGRLPVRIAEGAPCGETSRAPEPEAVTSNDPSAHRVRSPKVLLLGDSIRMSYQPFVTEALEAAAEVLGPGENCQYSLFTLSSLDRWIGQLGKPDIVHWNNGLHDVGHNPNRVPVQIPLEIYLGNLEIILRRLRQIAPIVIWATTTPVGPDRPFRSDQWSWRTEEVDRYNDAAVRLMKDLEVPINDLHDLVSRNLEGYLSEDHLHLNEAGRKACAEAVVASVAPYLSRAIDRAE